MRPSVWLLLAKGLMALMGLTSFAIGVWYEQQAAEGHREHQVSDFARVVELWKSTAGREFEGLQATARANNGPIVQLSANRTPDSLQADEHADQLPSYEPLVYRTKGVPDGFLPEVEISSSAPRDPYRSVVFTFTLANSTFEAGPFPLVVPRQRRCTWEGGHQTSMCQDFARLQRVCVQVKRVQGTSSSSWRLQPMAQETSGPSYGCVYDRGQWLVAKYEDTSAALTWDGYFNRKILRFTSLQLEVRSSADPYLYALYDTHGTLNFGMAAAEERELGLILMLIGLVLMCPGIARCCWCCYRRQQQRRDYHYRTRFPRRARETAGWPNRRDSPNAETVGMKYMVDEDGDVD